jgi:hypothetical protein
MPAETAGSRRTAARIVCGAISLSSAPFTAQTVFEHHEAGRIAAWPRQALHKAGTDRIRNDCAYDRDSSGCLQRRSYARATTGEDDIGRKPDQFRRESPRLSGIARRPAGVNVHVAALRPTQPSQFLQKCLEEALKSGIVCGCWQQYPDAPGALLRACRDGCHAAAVPRRPMKCRRLTRPPHLR